MNRINLAILNDNVRKVELVNIYHLFTSWYHSVYEFKGLFEFMLLVERF